jgi:hypothetical protein
MSIIDDLREIDRIILEAELPVPTVIAIDPGPIQSAYAVWDGKLKKFGIVQNEELRKYLRGSLAGSEYDPFDPATRCVIEQIASYGMPVGSEVFETVFWTGVFAATFGLGQTERIPRLTVKMHLCHDSKAKDGNIRAALIDRFGKPGTLKFPGMLHGVSKDVWQAVALAVTWWDRMGGGI